MCFPEFCEPFRQITEPTEGVVGTLIYNHLVGRIGDNLGHVIGI